MPLSALLVASLLLSPRQEPDLIRDGSFSQGFQHWTTSLPGGNPQTVTTEDPRVPTVARFEIPATLAGPRWAVSLSQTIHAFLKKDEPLTLRFFARGPVGGKVSAFVQHAREPFTDLFRQEFALQPEWKEYELSGMPFRDFKIDEAAAGFHLNYGAGMVEIGQVRLVRSSVQRASLDRPESLVVNGDFASPLGSAWTANGPMQAPPEIVTSEGRRALRLRPNPPENGAPWSVSLHQGSSGRIYPGDVVTIRAWMRSPFASRVGLRYEMAGPPHSKYMSGTFLLRPEWREFKLAARVPRGFAPGEARLAVFLGYGPGVVEIADVRVENHGAAKLESFEQTLDPYGGMPNPDTWRAAALARIEKIRKGDLTVQVVDAQGKPVPGVQVSVEQRRHAFRFGTAGPATLLLAEGETGDRYRHTVKRLFNTFTFENDLKWTGTNTPESDEQVEKAMRWLEAAGFQIKGHNLVWGSFRWLPAGFETLSMTASVAAVRQRVRTAVEQYRGRVYSWDVVNEAATERDLWNKVGWELFPETFRLAREADPQVKLVYNDYNITEEAAAGPGQRQEVIRLVKRLQEAGAPVDMIGMQCHVGLPLTPVSRVLEIVDEMAGLELPLEVTEFDVSVTDDKLHAQYTRDFLIAMFSHPKVESFIVWGFWEGAHWRAKEGGAMFRRDWTPRPAAREFEALVKGKWWTRATLKADAKGAVKTRAFYGTHRVTVTRGAKKTTVDVEVKPGMPSVAMVRL